MKDTYISDTLFHCWGKNGNPFEILISIAEKGFLLSRGSMDDIDELYYYDKNNVKQSLFCVQNARVCLTDIPVDKLHIHHAAKYGRWAIGFLRQTILNWGGMPVWYLPNFASMENFLGQAGAFFYGISEAHFFLKNTETMPPNPETSSRLIFARDSILRMQSFIKKMSKTESDQEYLYEREWRIVSGVSSNTVESPFRKLDDSEKNILIGKNPAWAKPLEVRDPRVTKKFSDERLIDSFHFFNGLKGGKTVSQSIEIILVPDYVSMERVESYIKKNPNLFSSTLKVEIFPDGTSKNDKQLDYSMA